MVKDDVASPRVRYPAAVLAEHALDMGLWGALRSPEVGDVRVHADAIEVVSISRAAGNSASCVRQLSLVGATGTWLTSNPATWVTLGEGHSWIT